MGLFENKESGYGFFPDPDRLTQKDRIRFIRSDPDPQHGVVELSQVIWDIPNQVFSVYASYTQ